MTFTKSALLGATALTLTIGFGAPATFAAGQNTNAASAQNNGAAHMVSVPKATGPKIYDAVVNADGSLARGSATASSNLSSGDYEVDFKKDVSQCTYVATLGNATAGTAPAGFITDAARASNPKAVFVQTSNISGTATNEQFHLVVVC